MFEYYCVALFFLAVYGVITELAEANKRKHETDANFYTTERWRITAGRDIETAIVAANERLAKAQIESNADQSDAQSETMANAFRHSVSVQAEVANNANLAGIRQRAEAVDKCIAAAKEIEAMKIAA